MATFTDSELRLCKDRAQRFDQSLSRSMEVSFPVRRKVP